jgi:hypothetical protein
MITDAAEPAVQIWAGGECYMSHRHSDGHAHEQCQERRRSGSTSVQDKYF